MWYSFRPYVSVAQRRAQAAREVEKRKKKGKDVAPVVIDGNTIAKTFWGKAWCQNLESYSDYANRLPRGRTYVRNGSVVDLQIQPGKIAALVSGSELYEVAITIASLSKGFWADIKSRCSGQIGSLVELLQGKLSKGVMDIVTARDDGLFPKPSEIDLSCSCPDWAGMCKHVAAVMYGIGARLDRQPDLLFRLRQVDHLELIAEAVPTGVGATKSKKALAGDIADVFGIELAPAEELAAAVIRAEQSDEAKASGTNGIKKTASQRRKTAEPVLVAAAAEAAASKSRKRKPR